MAAPPATRLSATTQPTGTPGPTRGGRRRLALLLGAVAVVVAVAAILVQARGEPERGVETGLVTAIRDRSLTEVDGFTLRTTDGRSIAFDVGRLELDPPAFPAGHLREHLALSQPVVVTWQRDGERLVATRLEDAPAG